MAKMQAVGTFSYWDTNRTYKMGEVFDVDWLQKEELELSGAAIPYEEPVKEPKQIPEGGTEVLFLSSTKDFKCGERVFLENESAFPLIESGVCVKAPILKEEEAQNVPAGATTIKFLVTTKDFKCGQVVELSNESAFPLIESGTAVPYCSVSAAPEKIPNGNKTLKFLVSTKDFKAGQIVNLPNEKAFPLLRNGICCESEPESEEKLNRKALNRMSKEELLEYAALHEINCIFSSKELIKAAILRNIRGEDLNA